LEGLVYQIWKIENNIFRLRKEQFSAVLEVALNSFTEESSAIIAGFKANELMLFDAKIVIIKKKIKLKKFCILI